MSKRVSELGNDLTHLLQTKDLAWIGGNAPGGARLTSPGPTAEARPQVSAGPPRLQ